MKIKECVATSLNSLIWIDRYHSLHEGFMSQQEVSPASTSPFWWENGTWDWCVAPVFLNWDIHPNQSVLGRIDWDGCISMVGIAWCLETIFYFFQFLLMIVSVYPTPSWAILELHWSRIKPMMPCYWDLNHCPALVGQNVKYHVVFLMLKGWWFDHISWVYHEYFNYFICYN